MIARPQTKEDALRNAVDAADHAHTNAHAEKWYPAHNWAAVAQAWSGIAQQLPEEFVAIGLDKEPAESVYWEPDDEGLAPGDSFKYAALSAEEWQDIQDARQHQVEVREAKHQVAKGRRGVGRWNTGTEDANQIVRENPMPGLVGDHLLSIRTGGLTTVRHAQALRAIVAVGLSEWERGEFTIDSSRLNMHGATEFDMHVHENGITVRRADKP
jgi:hypothetical protein